MGLLWSRACVRVLRPCCPSDDVLHDMLNETGGDEELRRRGLIFRALRDTGDEVTENAGKEVARYRPKVGTKWAMTACDHWSHARQVA